MNVASIDFSAQFGGRDAGAVALPHFKALKSAGKGVNIERFPFPKLAFILRVDGEVNRYGFSGPKHLEIDKGGEYLSVDIGITEKDRTDLKGTITSAILASPDLILAAAGDRGVDVDALDKALKSLCVRYAEALG